MIDLGLVFQHQYLPCFMDLFGCTYIIRKLTEMGLKHITPLLDDLDYESGFRRDISPW